MTEQEYRAELSKLRLAYEAQRKELHIRYARANNPYKIGDTVKDNFWSLRIEKIKVCLGISGLAECYYTGTVLKKDGTPTKRQIRREVYQSDIIG